MGGGMEFLPNYSEQSIIAVLPLFLEGPDMTTRVIILKLAMSVFGGCQLIFD